MKIMNVRAQHIGQGHRMSLPELSPQTLTPVACLEETDKTKVTTAQLRCKYSTLPLSLKPCSLLARNLLGFFALEMPSFSPCRSRLPPKPVRISLIELQGS